MRKQILGFKRKEAVEPESEETCTMWIFVFVHYFSLNVKVAIELMKIRSAWEGEKFFTNLV